MKKDKLYTQRKGMPAFMIDRRNNNIFDGLTPGQSNLIDSSGSKDGSDGGSDDDTSSGSVFNWQGMAGGMASAIPSNEMNIGGQHYRRGAWDAADPWYYTTNGAESDVGNAMSDAGISMTQAGLSSGQWGLALAGGIAKSAGDTYNALWGMNTDKEKLKNVNTSIAKNKNFVSNASNFDDIVLPSASYTATDVYDGAILTGGDADKKNKELDKQLTDSIAWVDRSVNNNMYNLRKDQLNNAYAHYTAFGGPLYNNMGGSNTSAIDYGFMSDYITMKNKQANIKNKVGGLQQAPAFMSSFGLGGDTQTHGSDWSSGLMHIDAGGSHSENPYGGVQIGVDPEGIPNLVEEDETIYNDYVFSNRIYADGGTLQRLHLPKKSKLTFAAISKKLEKQIKERENDPIAQRGFQANMEMLREEQERQKQEMDAARARETFEAMSPEEQVAVMENAAQQEAMAEQAAMQQPSPEEIAMAQQQQAMADGTEAMVGQEPQTNCFGGRINRFDNGGQAYTKMLNSLGFHTQKEFDDWAKENSIDFGDIWKDNPNTLSIDILGKLWSNEKFKEALKKKNPALAHAFETKGYDFGTYVPTSNSRATIQSISKGNWKATNGQGWFGSEDLAFKQATEGMNEDEIKALTTEQLAERMAKTDAYKNTSKWLENSDNALMYLNTLLNDPDTPDVAKKHALQYVKDGKWKDGYKYNYNDVFGKVRSTNPGTYWHTAMEANRGNEANNFVINEDGSIEPILGNVPTDWTSAGNYSWADENSDYTYNYYKRPAVAAKPEAAKTPEEKKAEEEKGVAPKHRAEWLRYAGLLGPAVGLGMMAAGIGKPDYSKLDAATRGAGNYTTANWMPIDTRVKYQPNDPWFYTSPIMTQSNATNRSILNSGVNQGTKTAGLLANTYNTNIALGKAQREQLDSNYDRYMKARQLRGSLEEANQREYDATSRFNAGAYNQASQFASQAQLQAARERLDRDAAWNSSIYGNVAGLFKGIGDYGTENYRMNRIAEMAARGDFGSATDSTPGFEGFLKPAKKKKSQGGKVNKKRGLTY